MKRKETLHPSTRAQKKIVIKAVIASTKKTVAITTATVTARTENLIFKKRITRKEMVLTDMAKGMMMMIAMSPVVVQQRPLISKGKVDMTRITVATVVIPTMRHRSSHLLHLIPPTLPLYLLHRPRWMRWPRPCLHRGWTFIGNGSSACCNRTVSFGGNWSDTRVTLSERKGKRNKSRNNNDLLRINWPA